MPVVTLGPGRAAHRRLERCRLEMSRRSRTRDLREEPCLHPAGSYASLTTVTWMNGRTPERMFAEVVTANYFETLGLRPARGGSRPGGRRGRTLSW